MKLENLRKIYGGRLENLNPCGKLISGHLSFSILVGAWSDESAQVLGNLSSLSELSSEGKSGALLLVVVPIFFYWNSICDTTRKYKMATWARHLYTLKRWLGKSQHPKVAFPSTGVFFCTSMYLCKTSMFCQPRCILLLHSRWQIHDEDRNAQGVCSFKTNSKRACSSDQTSTQGSMTKDIYWI